MKTTTYSTTQRKGLSSFATIVAGIALGAALKAEVPWASAGLREHAVDQARTEAISENLFRRGTRALVIVRHGRLVYERYAPGDTAKTRFGTASLAKALVGGLSLALALGDGRMKADDPAAKYIPAWQGDPAKRAITIRHLATHTSGIEDAEQDGMPHADLPGWKGAFWRRSPDPISIAIHSAPVLFPPGSNYHYSNPGMAALGLAVARSFKDGDLRAELKSRLFDALAIPESDWSISYGEHWDVDGVRVYANWGGGSMTARAVARLGQLVLQRGCWRGRQLIRSTAVEAVLAPSKMPLPRRSEVEPAPASGLCWYTNADRIWASVPPDAVAGAGAGHQLLLVVPSLELVVVRMGRALEEDTSRGRFWGPAYRLVFQPIVGAAEELPATPPYPPSPKIRSVGFAPVQEIRRAAIDSDNWPITWGDDGQLYTAYGDGRGFDPPVERKLSLGFARVEGGPLDFRGINVRSATGERTGDGVHGLKASGLLMVGGVLYMWVRNAGNAQLAWSDDHGQTWQWGFRIEESFGSPAFLNFGPDYGGVRDGYVYTYSQDGPSAYDSDDDVLLARVSRSRIRDRAAWEFFVRLDSAGQPVWSGNIAERGPVFRYPARCQRADAVYNAGLKRYLLALAYNHDGAWGLFDAPEPWGPWTTAFHTLRWDVPATHGYRLPAKWISAGGQALHVVFSGVHSPEPNYDAFCVRRATLNIR